MLTAVEKDAWVRRLTVGTIIRCIENTAHPENVGVRYRITKPGLTSVLMEPWGLGGKAGARWTPPKMKNLISVEGDTIRYQVEMRGDPHTIAWKITAP